MTPDSNQLLAELARDIVNQTYSNHWFYVVVGLLALITTGIGGLVFAYFSKRGTDLASAAAFEEVLKHLRRSTEAAEAVKQKISHADWSLKEFKTLRRTKLEELLTSAHEAIEGQELEAGRLFQSAVERTTANHRPMSIFRQTRALYFPELEKDAAVFIHNFHEMSIFLIESKYSIQLANIKQDENEFGRVLSPIMDEYKVKLPRVSGALGVLVTHSQKLMTDLIKAD